MSIRLDSDPEQLPSASVTRRQALAVWAGAAATCLSGALAGCSRSDATGTGLEAVWGRRGISDGRLQKPRAMVIDGDDRLYIVDMTGRIQVFDTEGNYLRGWRTPAIESGKPTGMSLDRHGHLMVADTHYYRVLFYTLEGELREELTIGGTQGTGPGRFNFVTDVVEDPEGNFYVSEYGLADRIQKFSPERQFVLQWGLHGSEPGQFRRPQSVKLDEQGRLWVADACNHRIQVFDIRQETPRQVALWGTQGSQPGQLSFPYDLVLDGRGHLYVCEFGNNRIQKFTLDGESLGCWGTPGRREGELSRPWALVQDSHERLYVLDTYNHRVQRIHL